jgi:hypothetical protein
VSLSGGDAERRGRHHRSPPCAVPHACCRQWTVANCRATARPNRAAMTNPPVVLFVCTHNAGRSLAAKVLLEHYAKGRVEVDPLDPSRRSGSTRPSLQR